MSGNVRDIYLANCGNNSNCCSRSRLLQKWNWNHKPCLIFTLFYIMLYWYMMIYACENCRPPMAPACHQMSFPWPGWHPGQCVWPARWIASSQIWKLQRHFSSSWLPWNPWETHCARQTAGCGRGLQKQCSWIWWSRWSSENKLSYPLCLLPSCLWHGPHLAAPGHEKLWKAWPDGFSWCLMCGSWSWGWKVTTWTTWIDDNRCIMM